MLRHLYVAWMVTGVRVGFSPRNHEMPTTFFLGGGIQILMLKMYGQFEGFEFKHILFGLVSLEVVNDWVV